MALDIPQHLTQLKIAIDALVRAANSQSPQKELLASIAKVGNLWSNPDFANYKLNLGTSSPQFQPQSQEFLGVRVTPYQKTAIELSKTVGGLYNSVLLPGGRVDYDGLILQSNALQIGLYLLVSQTEDLEAKLAQQKPSQGEPTR